jgi:hypothetical protein
VKKFIAYHSNDLPMHWIDLVQPIATFLDGPYAGVDVDLSEISKHKRTNGRSEVEFALPLSTFLKLADGS